MSEEQSFAKDHKFLIMIGGSILISIVLVAAAMLLYYSSGASQLDLSRPGFSTIRDKASGQEGFEGIAAIGDVDVETLNEFEKMYNEKLKEVEKIDAFSGDVLSPEALQINDKDNDK